MSYQPNLPSIMPIGAGGVIPDLPDLPDVPDTSSGAAPKPVSGGGLVDFGGMVASFRDADSALGKANSAERSFIAGKGNLLEMVLERVKADTMLSLASAEASKTTQAASTLMNLQV